MNEHIILDKEKIAKSTGGFWSTLENVEITSVGMLPNSVNAGCLAIAAKPKNWKHLTNDSHSKINIMIQKGANAVMVDKDWYEKNKVLYNISFLVVENTFIALHNLAIASRDESMAKRILVTGTEGKTSTKYALNYLISQQASCYAQETSANITVPILFSLSSLKKSSAFTVVEVSCPQPNRCVERSDIISPDLVIITNLNESHINSHGSVENLLKHKYESLHGLKENGICIINEDTDLYDDFIAIVNKNDKKISFATYSEKNENADVFLINADFHNLTWNVKASIDNEIVEYKINRVQGHWPLTSVGLLLELKKLGLDIKQAAKDIELFTHGWDSMGDINKMKISNGSFLFYDQYFSITEKALKSALEDVNRINIKGKKIVVISGELNSSQNALNVHKRFATYLNNTDIDILFTVGEHMEITINELKKQDCFKGHFFTTQQLKSTLLNTIQKNDLIFIKGMTRLNFKHLSDAIYENFEKIKL